MKYLVIKLFILFYFFLPELIHMSDFDCAKVWYNKNIHQINKEIIEIKGRIMINNDSSENIDIFIDEYNNKIRIDFDNQIFILEKNKSTKIFKSTNQLYIDKPDTILHNIVFSVFGGKYLNQDCVKISENQYMIKNYLNFDQIKLVYDNFCSNIEYINLESDRMNIYIDKIYIKITNNHDIFIFDNEYFKYDLRHEN